MANDEHVALLKKGVAAWSEWRLKNPDTRPDLTGAYLREADLTRADLTRAYPDGADLDGADLTGANLTRANLTSANHALISPAVAFTAHPRGI
jgi:uncharacterized protein YjbI with pentapeptide repeats